MEQGFLHNVKNGVHYLTIPAFDKTGLVAHGFTTRHGGVSAPPLNSMNLGFNRGDNDAAVYENYRIAGEALGFDEKRLVAFSQVHGNDIRIACESDAGCVYLKGNAKYDGIVTNIPNLPIATYHADCVPVFLLDPVCRVIGAAHAGWKGTALKTAAHAVEKMVSEFGCRHENILAAIGPCSGKCCYETDADVPEAMLREYGGSAQPYITKNNNKWNIDLAGINYLSLIQIGILDKNITMSNECTCCNDTLYWSNRKTRGIRGCMAAVIMLY